MAVGYWFEIWRRPGHANFGRVIDDPPFETASFHIGVGLRGDGAMTLPDSFTRFDDILKIAGTNSRGSLVRIREDRTGSVVGEWIPNALTPAESKDAPRIDVSGNGINELADYAITEAYDWDGSPDWESKFPDWIFGGRNLLNNPGFEEQNFTPRIYWLLMDESITGGTFTLSVGADNVVSNWDINDGALEGAIEAGIAAIDDLSVTPLEGVPRGYRLVISATSGTFTISHGASTTAALAHNIGAAALETAIEGLTGITNVTVATQTVDGVAGFRISLHTPATAELSIDTTNLSNGSAGLTVARTSAGFALELVKPPIGVSFTLNAAGLVGGSARLHLQQEGDTLASSWTRSTQVSAGTPREYGTYGVFEPTQTFVHSGSWAMLINPSLIDEEIDRYAGIQQIVSVTPGGIYQASIWVRTNVAGQSYRLVIRGLDEDLISTPLFAGNISPPPNIWVQVKLRDIIIPEGDEQIIFRFANINASGNPAAFYVDDAVFAEGLAPTTVGHIVRLLYEDATSNHAGRRVWENDANPGTSYLTLDFTDDVDSSGGGWSNNEVSIRIWMRMTLFQVLEALEDQEGIEWRIVPNNAENGTWKLQIYDEGRMDDSPDVAILGGADDTRRMLRRFRPPTLFHVEGAERVTARRSAGDLDPAFGRIETARIDRQAPDMVATKAAANRDRHTALLTGLNWSYELTNPVQDAPLLDYRIGDSLVVHDPPDADGVARLWELNAFFSVEKTTWDIDLIPEELE